MTEPVQWTVPRIRALKGKSRITSLTAYDFSTARLVDEAGIQLIIVGDSLGMTVLGYEDTIPVTMADMLHHTAAVSRGARHALVVADMPFLSYQVSIEQAVLNAGRFIKESGADAVKIEGGAFRVPTIRALIENGIPVLGHIGLTPQSIHAMGGYKVQGKTEEGAQRIVADATAIDEAGVFAMVLEGMPAALASSITTAVGVPTIGIGAGAGCDGQVLVVNDVLGLYGEFKPKFVKRYANLGPEIQKAFAQYKKEVEDGSFPGPEHSY
ncbi:MAG: 3-methyl-2-oxobutanoate hydroxymethyltransferase [Verrucomicrobia bacterium A1]|nr:MAG: 3-methyl-2-oxobutanoate hydroxymethyltransferase [Verrucomicrobia bacterium A1]